MSRREMDLPSLTAFLRDATATDGGRASSGVIAALAVALTTDLAAQVARDSTEWSARGGALAQAEAIRDRALSLAFDLEQAYGQALAALAATLHTGAPSPEGGGAELGETLNRAVELLVGIAEVASDGAELAALVARSGATLVRADAVAATMLASAAAEISAHLVEVNLLVGPDDERCQRVRELLASASRSREVARGLGP